MIKRFLNFIRIKQWIKNFLIFAPLIFSGDLFVVSLLSKTFLAFSGFCLLASGMYILNDFLDRKRDQYHPQKKERFIEGQNKQRFVFLVIFLLLGMVLLEKADTRTMFLAGLYVLVNLAYSISFKRVPFLEIFLVSFGFIIRLWVGGVAIGVWPSFLMQACVFFLALFLSFAKRRYERLMLKGDALLHRPALQAYSKYRLDQFIIFTLVFTITFYLVFILQMIAKGFLPSAIIYSFVFVVYGLLRYVYLIYIQQKGDDPCELILSDKALLATILLWMILNLWIIYAA